MLKRFAPLVPLALVTLLYGCASTGPVAPSQDHRVAAEQSVKAKASASSVFTEEELASEDDLNAFSSNGKPYQLPALADASADLRSPSVATRMTSAHATPSVQYSSSQIGADDTPTHSPATVCPSAQPGASTGGAVSLPPPHAASAASAASATKHLVFIVIVREPSAFMVSFRRHVDVQQKPYHPAYGRDM